MVLQPCLGHGVLKQLRFYKVGSSALHSIPSILRGLMGCFLICFLPPTCLSWEALPETTTSIACWIIETHKPSHHSSRSGNPSVELFIYCSNRMLNGSKHLVFRACQMSKVCVRDFGPVLAERLLSLVTVPMKMEAAYPFKTVATQYQHPNAG